MSRTNTQDQKKLGAGRVVAVAIENNKTSQYAAKWAVDNLLPKDQSLLLIHVRQKTPSNPPPSNDDDGNECASAPHDNESKELFDSFRVFCNRKSIQFKEILLEDMDISKALIESISLYSIELLVLGAASRGGLVRFRTTDVPTVVTKAAPPFCTIYIISKGKISSVRSATSPLANKPPAAAAPPQRNNHQQTRAQSPQTRAQSPSQRLDSTQIITRSFPPRPAPQPASANPGRFSDDDDIISPFTRSGNNSSYGSSIPDSDISFINSTRPSVDRLFPTLFEDMDAGMAPRLSMGSECDARSFCSSFSGPKSSMELGADYSFSSQVSSRLSISDNNEEVEAEMRRLKLELKQTMEMYSSACKEALTAKEKAMELQRWKMEEQKNAGIEKEKCKAAMRAAEASQRIAELEAHKRKNAEKKAQTEVQQTRKAPDSFGFGTARYRRYSIEEIENATQNFSASLKIGEGGYGPVYKCELDHTQVAVKVLKPDAAQGREQFNQEVEVLSCIRHPNMVLLLGACPEYGCLVYEYMANGSLDDCLFRRGRLPPLPWQLRFQIAAEIATGLLFLHQSKPEPLVHRDLKPGNILLDRNFVSKISDVGLARLVPPSVADTVTQYRMTSTAGTFCYIDPEYQQTGMLGIKSDVYSLGIMLLQIVTAKPPMGLTHHVGRSIQKGTFADMLDPAVQDWPVEHAMHFAKLALQCAEMRKKDRPDLGKVVLPELNKLRAFAEESMPMMMMFGGGAGYNNVANSHHSSNSSIHSSNSNESNSQNISGFSGYESRSSSSSLGRV